MAFTVYVKPISAEAIALELRREPSKRVRANLFNEFGRLFSPTDQQGQSAFCQGIAEYLTPNGKSFILVLASEIKVQGEK